MVYDPEGFTQWEHVSFGGKIDVVMGIVRSKQDMGFELVSVVFDGKEWHGFMKRPKQDRLSDIARDVGWIRQDIERDMPNL